MIELFMKSYLIVKRVIMIKLKWLTILIFLVVAGLCTTMFFYYQYHPKVMITIEISPIDDKQYGSIGLLETVKYPEKENFKQLTSVIKVSYSNKIEDVEINLSKTFSELLGKDIYWSGENWEYPNPNNRMIEHNYEMILYTGETNEQQLKELLNKGTITVTWKENEKEINEKHSLDESVKFK